METLLTPTSPVHSTRAMSTTVQITQAAWRELGLVIIPHLKYPLAPLCHHDSPNVPNQEKIGQIHFGFHRTTRIPTNQLVSFIVLIEPSPSQTQKPVRLIINPPL
jgi:hypothetical protein